MSGNKIVLDTNILVYLLEGNEDLKNILADFSVYISFISEMELLAKPNLKDSDKKAILALLRDTYIIDMNQEIKDKTVNNKINFGLKLPDGFILATSQWLQLPLLTSDREFEKAEESESNIIIY